MNEFTVRDFLRLVRSTRIKDRQEAIALLKGVLQDPRNFNVMSSDSFATIFSAFTSMIETGLQEIRHRSETSVTMVAPALAVSSSATVTPSIKGLASMARAETRMMVFTADLRHVLYRVHAIQELRLKSPGMKCHLERAEEIYLLARSVSILLRHACRMLSSTWVWDEPSVVLDYCKWLHAVLLSYRVYRNHVPGGLWKTLTDIFFQRIAATSTTITGAVYTEMARCIARLFLCAPVNLQNHVTGLWAGFVATYAKPTQESPLHHALTPALNHFLVECACVHQSIPSHLEHIVTIAENLLQHWKTRSDTYRIEIISFIRYGLAIAECAQAWDTVAHLARELVLCVQSDINSGRSTEIRLDWFVCCGKASFQSFYACSEPEVFANESKEKETLGTNIQRSWAYADLFSTAVRILLQYNRSDRNSGILRIIASCSQPILSVDQCTNRSKRTKRDHAASVWDDLLKWYEDSLDGQKCTWLQLFCSALAKYASIALPGAVEPVIENMISSSSSLPRLQCWQRVFAACLIDSLDPHLINSRALKLMHSLIPSRVEFDNDGILSSALMLQKLFRAQLIPVSVLNGYFSTQYSLWDDSLRPFDVSSLTLNLLLECTDVQVKLRYEALLRNSLRGACGNSVRATLEAVFRLTVQLPFTISNVSGPSLRDFRFHQQQPAVQVEFGSFHPSLIDYEMKTAPVGKKVASFQQLGSILLHSLQDGEWHKADPQVLVIFLATLRNLLSWDNVSFVELVDPIMASVCEKISTSVEAESAHITILMALEHFFGIYRNTPVLELLLVPNLINSLLPCSGSISTLVHMNFIETFVEQCLLRFLALVDSVDGNVGSGHRINEMSDAEVAYHRSQHITTEYLNLVNHCADREGIRTMISFFGCLVDWQYTSGDLHELIHTSLLDFACDERWLVDALHVAYAGRKILATSTSIRNDIRSALRILTTSFSADNDLAALNLVATLLGFSIPLDCTLNDSDRAQVDWCIRQANITGRQHCVLVLCKSDELCGYQHQLPSTFIETATRSLNLTTRILAGNHLIPLASAHQMDCQEIMRILFGEAVDTVSLYISSKLSAAVPDFFAPLLSHCVQGFTEEKVSAAFLSKMRLIGGYPTVECLISSHVGTILAPWYKQISLPCPFPSVLFGKAINTNRAHLLKPIGLLLGLCACSASDILGLCDRYADVLNDGFDSAVGFLLANDTVTGSKNLDRMKMWVGRTKFNNKLEKRFPEILFQVLLAIDAFDMSPRRSLQTSQVADVNRLMKILDSKVAFQEEQARSVALFTIYTATLESLEIICENPASFDPAAAFSAVNAIYSQFTATTLLDRQCRLIGFLLRFMAIAYDCLRHDLFCDRFLYILCAMYSAEFDYLLNRPLSQLLNSRASGRVQKPVLITVAQLLARLERRPPGQLMDASIQLLQRSGVTFVPSWSFNTSSPPELISANCLEEKINAIIATMQLLLNDTRYSLTSYWRQLRYLFAQIECQATDTVVLKKMAKQLWIFIESSYSPGLEQCKEFLRLLGLLNSYVEILLPVSLHEEPTADILSNPIERIRYELLQYSLTSCARISDAAIRCLRSVFGGLTAVGSAQEYCLEPFVSSRHMLDLGTDMGTFYEVTEESQHTSRFFQLFSRSCSAASPLRDRTLQDFCIRYHPVAQKLLSSAVAASFHDSSENADFRRTTALEIQSLLAPKPECNFRTKLALTLVRIIRALPGDQRLTQYADYDFLILAKAAFVCQNYEEAVLYLEIARAVANQNLNEQDETIRLARDIFSAISEQDLRYGLEPLPTIASITQRLALERNFSRSLEYSDAYHHGLEAYDDEVVRSLFQMGLHHTLRNYLGSLKNCASLSESMYSLAWRSGMWDWSFDGTLVTNGKQRVMFDILRHKQSTDCSRMESILRLPVIPDRIDLMQSIADAETFAHLQSPLWKYSRIWDKRFSSYCGHCRFDSFEERLAWCIQLLVRQCGHMHELVGHILDQAARYQEFCLEHRRPQFALNMWHHLDRMMQHARPHAELEARWNAQKTYFAAQIMWDTDQQLSAIRLIKECCTLMENDTNLAALHCKCLLNLGEWVSLIHSEPPDGVISYFERAIASAGDDMDVRLVAGYRLARYCDLEHKRLAESDLWMADDRLFQLQEAEINEFNVRLRNCTTTLEKQRLTSLRKKAELQLQLDRVEQQRRMDGYKRYLVQSLHGYARTLAVTDQFDNCVYRFCALWFANVDMTSNDLPLMLESVPTSKFVPLFHQLSAKLSTLSSEAAPLFRKTLFDLVYRIASDHPHHCLYRLIALSGENADQYPAALLQALQQKSTHSDLIATMIQLVRAYVQLANVDMKKANVGSSSKEFRMDAQLSLRGLRDMTGVCVSTVELPLRRDKDYDRDIISIKRFSDTFRLVGGINVPKLLDCVGSNGCIFKILLKGNDDLRQDAVLEQIFRTVHSLLGKDEETKRRNLQIRTYKVVPLSPRSGLVEWVENTIPLGTWLLSAHARICPSDMKPTHARDLLKGESERKGSNPKSKLRVYLKIIHHLHPVFRHFFFEQFSDAALWFQSRLRYARSTATMSIVGYVLGIGDRHPYNILLDQATGELIHIDLGIAFDLGKLLSVPEIVPFRLTRDMVDGMGITGVDGTFRRCCEFTLQVMRNEAEMLMTILEVLRHDPLYSWTLSPLHQKKRRNDEESAEPEISETTVSHDNGSKDAKRALLGIQRKLSAFTSTACQVNELIQAASSTENLAQMFHGWLPFL